MRLYDWLLFFHLLGGFVVLAALVALWAIVFATRSNGAYLPMADAVRIGNIAGPMVGAGIALVVGVILSFQVDGYHVWNGWIVGSIALWALATWSGLLSGKLFAAADGSRRRDAILMQGVNTVAILFILVLMVWKPGA